MYLALYPVYIYTDRKQERERDGCIEEEIAQREKEREVGKVKEF